VLHKAVGQAWLAGVAIDWAGYHAHARCRRVPLPTYPFERQRFWVEQEDDTQLAADPIQDVSARRAWKDWFHLPSWRISAPLHIARTAQQEAPSGCIVLADDTAFASVLTAELKRCSAQVIRVRSGATYAYGAEEIVIDVEQPAHYLRMLDDLKRNGQEFETIVHAFNVGGRRDAAWTFDQSVLDRTLYGVLYLVQALNESMPQKPVRLNLLSSNLASIIDEDVIQPEKSVLNGVGRVISREFGQITCKCVDVSDPGRAGERLAPMAACIAQEVLLDTPDVMIAYRGTKRWVQAFENVPHDVPLHHAGLLRQQGVYLITGGLGGIGLAIAQYLTRTVQARLVLVGRSGLPARDSWQSIIDSDRESTVARQILDVMQLESLGSEVTVMGADVADAAQIAEVVRTAVSRFGAIHGVVHAAGVPGGGAMTTKTREAVDRVVRPKIRGTVALATALQGMQLDLFVLCSSMNAIIGGFGQYDYCAANAFMDGFAHRHDDATGTRYIAINWDAWKDVGMAVNTQLPEYLRKQREKALQSAIQTGEGMDVFASVLHRPMPQWMIVTRNPELLLAQERSLRASEDLGPVKTGPLQARPELTTAYLSPSNSIEATLAEIWQELLAVDQVGIRDNFFELGGDSLLITRLHTMMRNRLPAETHDLPLKSLFEHSTIASIAAVIGEREEAQQFSEDMARLRQASLVTEEGEI
jgi:NAD(P)-dependent dehydrogenase (short-subunit alcohol dehydrogenase family)